MSKYIIELDDRIKLVTSVGVTENGVVYTTSDYVHNLEELNSDYINENFGELQDEAYKQGYADAEMIWRAPSSDNEFYQKGLEDGKKSTEKGCDGCKYYEDTSLTNPCSECSRGHVDHYKPVSDPDHIDVGDEVATKTGKKYTAVSFGYGGTVCGFDKEGMWTGWNPKEVTKTGKHYDIQSILEAMRK